MKKLPCLEVHSIPYFKKKFQKTTAISNASSSVTKSPRSHSRGKGALGVKFFWRWALHFGRMDVLLYNTPIFWTLPLHLEGWNLPFLMELWDIVFLKNIYLQKIRVQRIFV
jgi:hypothetical protein